MPLSFPPQLTGDNSRDIIALQSYLYDLVVEFDNAAGSAIDPTEGQGGDGSLTIIDAPTAITYTPTVNSSRDGVSFGQIDITFTLPARAVGALVYYRETGTTVWHTSYAATSPFTLQSLKVGVEYDLRIVGIAANGALGPASTVTTVTLPISSLSRTIGVSSFFDSGAEDDIPYIIPGLTGPIGLTGALGPIGIDGADGDSAYDLFEVPSILRDKIVHLRTGVAAVNGAPLKFISGPLTTVSEIGAVEFLSNALYITQTSSSLRKPIAFVPLQSEQSGILNTTYTASTIKSHIVIVTVRCVVSLAGGTAYIQAKSDSSAPPTTNASGIVGIQSGLLGEDNSFQLVFIVNIGMNYRVDSIAVNGTVTLTSWFEAYF